MGQCRDKIGNSRLESSRRLYRGALSWYCDRCELSSHGADWGMRSPVGCMDFRGEEKGFGAAADAREYTESSTLHWERERKSETKIRSFGSLITY